MKYSISDLEPVREGSVVARPVGRRGRHRRDCSLDSLWSPSIDRAKSATIRAWVDQAREMSKTGVDDCDDKIDSGQDHMYNTTMCRCTRHCIEAQRCCLSRSDGAYH